VNDRAALREIAALIEAYRAGFEMLDAEKLCSIWDRDYDIIYCPIELTAPLMGWDQISDYYDRVTRHFRRVDRMEVDNVTTSVFDDLAIAFFTFEFEGEVRETTATFKARGRNTFVFRRGNGGWKGIHYHESSTPQ
jgi:ketosteroid isomerase-like protein